MQVKKGERKDFDRQLYTGVFSGIVRSVNPPKEEMGKMFGADMPEEMAEMKYEGTDEKTGKEFVTVSFWLQADTPEKQWFNQRFRIVDKEATNKNGDKAQYVNATMGSSWIDDEKNLQEWFTHFQDKDKNNIADKPYRKGLQGEAGLYEFLKAWLSGVDWFDQDTNVMADTKKMFRNINKWVREEYQPHIKVYSEWESYQPCDKKKELEKEVLTGPVICCAVVYTGDKEGQPVHYQNLWNAYLPGYNWKKVCTAIQTNNWNDKGIKKWYDGLTSGEYSCKDAYTTGYLVKFDASSHQQATNETFIAPTVNDTSY